MYPEIAARNLIRVINGSTGTALMQAIQTGECQGAIAPDVHVRYALGPADPSCLLSTVTPIGQNLNTGCARQIESGWFVRAAADPKVSCARRSQVLCRTVRAALRQRHRGVRARARVPSSHPTTDQCLCASPPTVDTCRCRL